MKENSAGREVEVEAMEVIDLGNVTEETRQFHPIQIIQDSPVTWGRNFSE